jgi:hypothetical protein
VGGRVAAMGGALEKKSSSSSEVGAADLGVTDAGIAL